MSSQCKHPQFINFRCLVCGMSQKDCGSHTVPFDYIVPNMSLSLPEINRLRNYNLEESFEDKKLHLLLDLDHTLIHTTELNKLTLFDKDYVQVGQNQLKGHVHDSYLHELYNSGYVLKKRPGTTTFLQELNFIFNLSIYTMGERSYAKMVAKVLDPEKRIFKNVIAREDCTTYGKKGLDVVLSHEKMVLIVDDNKDVWDRHTKNLIQIKPYIFFGNNHSQLSAEDRVKDEISHGDMDLELRRVLDILKWIHSGFYCDDNYGDITSKDVRKLLDDLKSYYAIEEALQQLII